MEKYSPAKIKWHARCFPYVPQETTSVEDSGMAPQNDRAGDSGSKDRNSGNRGGSSNTGGSSDRGMRGSPGRSGGNSGGSSGGSSGGKGGNRGGSSSTGGSS